MPSREEHENKSMISKFIIINILQGDIKTKAFLFFVFFIISIAVPIMNIYVSAESIFHLTDYHVALFGKYLTYGL